MKLNSNEPFSKFLTSVDTELGRDAESIHLFEWVIEDRYETKISDNIDFYADRPDLRSIENEQMIYELNLMENYFVSTEDYEKCASITKIRSELKSVFG